MTPSGELFAETVAEWEPGTFVENLAAGPGGGMTGADNPPGSCDCDSPPTVRHDR
ncbi:hypothetical protein Aple_087160 [Acrocarpospora pleiomorpha]|uniref:Uncharacterized protein n=1 Tax=Acrocarpospora pleiomorpha TaxID=90975 RepID=A0A5M3XXF4_9ACTN|nr:hypothetical protein [Acrocarpospora pleiomorpha]GES25817.1 hypothetical protein Aple_087160 [Acrocarpospora pleiomorpha]